jgi:hypothetical protein
LGPIVQDYTTSAEAIKFANLNYTVEHRKLFIHDNENQLADEHACLTQKEKEIKIGEIAVPNYYSIMRTDLEQLLSVVG